MYYQKDVIKLSDIVKEQEEKRKEYMRMAFYLPKILDKKKNNKNLRFSYGIIRELREARNMLHTCSNYNNIYLKIAGAGCNKDVDILRAEKEYKIETEIHKSDFFKIKKDGDKIFYRRDKYIEYNNEAYEINTYTIIVKELYKYDDLKNKLYIGTIDGKKIFCKQNADLPNKDEGCRAYVGGFMDKDKDKDHPINVLLNLMGSYPSKVSSQLLKYKDNIKKLKEIKISKELKVFDAHLCTFMFTFCKAFNLFDAKMCKSEEENTCNFVYMFKINNLLELLIFACIYVYKNKDSKILSYLSYLVKERENEKVK